MPSESAVLSKLHVAGFRATLLAAAFFLIGFVRAANAGDILLSLSADRSAPDLLDGRSVSGDIYIFMGTDAGVKSARYFLDSSPAGAAPAFTATAAPFDLAGSRSPVSASPYDTRNIANGSHILTARAELVSGGSVDVQAAFTVSNARLALPFTDNFNDGNADGWTVFNDAREGASNWRVSGGMYRELNYVGYDRSAMQKGYHAGTNAYLNGSLGLTSYQFSVVATPFSAEGNDLGVLFRFRNADNYYRLSFSGSDGFTRLEKKLNGNFTTLAKNARGYIRGVPLNIAINARGSLFQVTVNGEKLFAFTDASLSSGGVGLYCRDNCAFDNVSITANPSAPSIVIAKPEAFSVTASNTIRATAVVFNKPAGGTVEFTLGGRDCGAATESPVGVFHATCTSGSYQNQMVARLLSGGAVISTDVNSSVNLRGNNYAAVGDSITWGVRDNYEADNRESSGLVVSSRGYEAPLAQLLNASNPFSSIVYNNGFPGDTSAAILSRRIGSVLERHADADTVLLMIGTNDVSRNLPSGSGCAGAACNNTFKGNIQKIIDRIAAAGKRVVVAMLPPRFDQGTRHDPLHSSQNALTAGYNQVIRNELSRRIVGPDLFAAFLGAGYNRFSLFTDSLHPNALGYRVIAQLWFNQLAGATGFPFILNNICVRPAGGGCENPTDYKQNLIEIGDTYYVDRSFTISQIPSILAGGVWVMPKAGYRTATSANHLQLTFNGTATVYVAYDDGDGGRPAWLSGFADTGTFLRTTNAAASTMRVYRKGGVAGGITLGGNRAAGASGSSENYVTIIKKGE